MEGGGGWWTAVEGGERRWSSVDRSNLNEIKNVQALGKSEQNKVANLPHPRIPDSKNYLSVVKNIR